MFCREFVLSVFGAWISNRKSGHKTALSTKVLLQGYYTLSSGFSPSLTGHRKSAPSHLHHCSNKKVGRTGPPFRLLKPAILLTALRVAAGVADDTALLLGEAAGAVGAGPYDRQVLRLGGAVFDEVVFGHGAGDAVGHGEDGVRADAGGVAVLDTAELVHYLGGLRAVGHGERHHTPQSVREGRCRTAGLAQDHEALPRPELVVVHRDVHRAVAGLHLLRHPGEGARAAVARFGQRDVLDDLDLAGVGRQRLDLGLARGEDLRITRAIAVDRHRLAPQGVGEPVGVLDVLRGRFVREVNGLGDAHRGVLLERRLHPDVPLGRDVVRGHPHAAHVLRNLRYVAYAAVLGNLLHQVLGVEASLSGELHELGVHVGQFHVRLTAHKGDGEERFYAARAARDYGDGPCGSYGSDGRVTNPVPAGFVPRSLVVRHQASLLGQGTARLPCLVVDELHHPFGECQPLFGVVGDAELYEEVGKAHDAESDATVAAAHLVDLGQRVAVHLDDVVEETYRH